MLNNDSDPPGRDNLYYLEPIVFQVEDSLFKVPQYFFTRDSEVFTDMLSLPQPSENGREGSCDARPLILRGVNKVDFQRLLRVMYPLDINPPESRTKDEWVSVLKLSTMWRFIEIRKHSIDKLTWMTLDPVERVVLAKAYKVPEWLQKGYRELAVRMGMMSDEEAQKIGYVTAIRVWHVREEYWRRVRSGYDFDMNNLERVFAEELKEVRAAYAEYN